ncbi:MAG: HAD family hydrolase [Candidatus Bathyarchaeota archaeon]|nr:HAD family hydrolase [Candidatus Bathyarchaeota archaeon]
MLKVKGILIDLDGTIVDSREAYAEALKRAWETLGLGNFNPAIALEIPRRLEQNQPINHLIPEGNVEKFLEIYLKTYYTITEHKTKPLPNVSKTLEELSKRAKLALLTMRRVPKEKILRELEKFGIAKSFHCIVTALDTPFPKPSPRAITVCAEKLGVNVSECAVVGDSISDVRAGKNAGAKTVAVLSGIFSRDELAKEKPDLILKNINELLKVLG